MTTNPFGDFPPEKPRCTIEQIAAILSPENLAVVITDHALRPRPTVSTLLASEKDTLWLNLPRTAQQDRVLTDVNSHLSVRVRPSADLKAACETTIYGAPEGHLDDHYYLHLIKRHDGVFALHLKFQRILGGKLLGVVPPDLVAQIDRARLDQGKSLISKDHAELRLQLSQMIALGSCIDLPKHQLTRYDDIKKAMLSAGGTYVGSRRERGPHFSFPVQVDAATLLEQLASGKKVNTKKETQFFATPIAQGQDLLRRLGSVNGLRVLEPSAGQAALADLARDAGAAEVVTIENWDVNAQVLRDKGYEPIERDFLEVKPQDTGLFDAVLMNPPFSGRQDIAHVCHALSFLQPTGKLAAIISNSYQHSGVKASQNFRSLLELARAEPIEIEAGAFKESGTNVSTTSVSLDMALILNSLEEIGSDGSEYGLNLGWQWELCDAVSAQSRNSQQRPVTL